MPKVGIAGYARGMTTKKRRPARTKPDTTLPETLEQFAAKLDAEAGEAQQFADRVRELYVVRHHIDRLDSRRKDIYEEVKVRFRRGNDVVLDQGEASGGYYLREITTKVSTYRTVEAATVKKVKPELWKAARSRQPWVSVKAPDEYPVPPLAGRSAKLPPGGAVLRQLDMATLMRHYKAPVFDRIGELREDEKALKAELEAVAAVTSWDGEATKFADGWTAGLWRLAFDGDLARRLDPKTWEALAIEKQRGGVTRIQVTGLDRAEEFGLVDLDGEERAQ
ncbi:hypothetical protein I5G58_gp071 [Mycobacterium phage BirdsNest]|uniref:Uncharacterized protein n=1 Tax=Mycobacterium phage BirdsNest TaxID=2686231 RepID=A0A6B9L9D8_9CAUD|nr:hypothetical protein I5G58_gp071 [Mycobacterium phage BirdsNest]QHB37373.1 hypothetical protein PBI_BIRDSNEST_71 [Mycobacterium phage BirdsNest]